MRIEGIILPSDWDDDGQVTAWILATSDEGEFRIEYRQLPMRLEKYLRQKVIVYGKLTGSSLLKIDEIKVSNMDLPPICGGPMDPTGSDNIQP